MTEHATQTAIVRRTVLTLSELPPSANNLHRHFERGGKIIRVKTSRYARWRKDAAWELAAQRPLKFDGPYRLEIAVQRDWGTKRARDIDNIIKPVSDALVAAGVIHDDSLAESVFAEWRDDCDGLWISLEAA